MSAYQLSNEKYQLISDFLYEESMNRSPYSHYFEIRDFIGFEKGSEKHHSASEEEIKKAVKLTVRNLYNLNRLALVTRYSEPYQRDDQTFFEPKIRYEQINEKEAIHALKSLRYQCAEYLTSDTKIFERLGNLIGEICTVIFMRKEERCVNE